MHKSKVIHLYDSTKTAERIKYIAKLKKIPLNVLLSNCELGINTISKMAKGKDITLSNFYKLAEALGCSLDYLTGRTDCPDVAQPKQAPEAPASGEKPEGETIPEKE